MVVAPSSIIRGNDYEISTTLCSNVPLFIPLSLLQRTVYSPLVEGYSQCQVQSKEDGNEICTNIKGIYYVILLYIVHIMVVLYIYNYI